LANMEPGGGGKKKENPRKGRIFGEASEKRASKFLAEQKLKRKEKANQKKRAMPRSNLV